MLWHNYIPHNIFWFWGDSRSQGKESCTLGWHLICINGPRPGLPESHVSRTLPGRVPFIPFFWQQLQASSTPVDYKRQILFQGGNSSGCVPFPNKTHGNRYNLSKALQPGMLPGTCWWQRLTEWLDLQFVGGWTGQRLVWKVCDHCVQNAAS